MKVKTNLKILSTETLSTLSDEGSQVGTFYLLY
jgi:hypothetical protein